MYNIAICDDLEMDRTHLRERIITLLDEKEARFYEYTSGKDLLEAMEDIPFDLIFLDIQMEGMDGEETARQIRKRDDSLVLVFVTGKVDPSPRSFIVQPYRFIKKNMTDEEKDGYIQDALIRMEEIAKAPSMTAKCDGSKLVLKPDDIVYIEKYKKTTLVHLSPLARRKHGLDADTEVRIADKLGDLYEVLRHYGFGYPHDSYIINFKYLMRCTYNEFKLEGYEEIGFKITRSKALEFNRLKTLFMRGKYPTGRRG